MSDKMSAREVALKILYEIYEKESYSNILLSKYLEKYELNKNDRGLITELVYGIIRWQITLDYSIMKFSKVKIKKISTWILNILRLGVYQIYFMDRIPNSAACNESVKLAKRYGHHASAAFVNGVLRSLSKNNLNDLIPSKDQKNYLSIKYSFPQEIIDIFLSQYKEAFVEELLDSLNKPSETILRVNTLKTSKEKLIEQLNNLNIETKNSNLCEDAIILKDGVSLLHNEAFLNGLFQVQDESSMIVAKVLDPKENENILDVCSAPGGKATHIAQIMKNKGNILALDIYEHKLKLINDNCKRLGINIIQTKIQDARSLCELWIDKFDRVLVDAPCSGLGIIKRKPEIKYFKNIETINELSTLQLNILNVSSKYVKKNGILVYSTCTMTNSENIDNVKMFLENNDNFELDEINNIEISDKESKLCYIQMFPNIHNVDGFFIAKFKRRK